MNMGGGGGGWGLVFGMQVFKLTLFLSLHHSDISNSAFNSST